MTAERILPAPVMPGSARRPAELFYYRQLGIIVTGRSLWAGGYRYEIADLVELTRTRGSVHAGTVAALAIAVCEAGTVAPLAGVLGGTVAWALTTVALSVPCLIGAGCARRWPAQFELQARYRGRVVTLFATRDEREFGRISRAIQRATEAVRRN